MNVEQLIFWGGCLIGGSIFVVVLMVFRTLSAVERVVREITPDYEGERRDMFQFIERLWEKKEFASTTTIAQAHAAERVERIRSDADVEKAGIRAEVSRTPASEQSDLVNTGPDPAAML